MLWQNIRYKNRGSNDFHSVEIKSSLYTSVKVKFQLLMTFYYFHFLTFQINRLNHEKMEKLLTEVIWKPNFEIIISWLLVFWQLRHKYFSRLLTVKCTSTILSDRLYLLALYNNKWSRISHSLYIRHDFILFI